MFQLHPRLDQDTATVCQLPLSRVLLMNDSRFSWLILVPALPDLRELHDLDVQNRSRLIEEIAQASLVLEDLFAPDKINVGAIGNMVPQLHIHVVARRGDDAAWPAPVWGHGTAEPYGADQRTALCDQLAGAFRSG